MNITAVGVVATALIASPILLSATIAFRPPVCPQTRRSPMSSAVTLFATIESQQEQQAAPNQFDDQDMDISETISEEKVWQSCVPCSI